ncbi:hypothetical protein B0J14DRAFT_658302 [Halenospora varia]|nr:hypothetical protein B0J14DRAFT_658302 [Halenospora varia]
MSSEIGQENSRSGSIIAAAITVITLSFFAVLLRLISRLALIRRATLDDLFIVVAWLIALAMSIAMCLGTRYGLGKHDQYIRLDWRGTLHRLQYAQKKHHNYYKSGIGQRPLPGGPARIGETLNFLDLKALAKFLTTGPGRRDDESFQGQHLAHIKFIRIVYRDDWAVSAWQQSTGLQRLQIYVPSYATFGIDSPGVWSLLKIQGLKAVILSSRRGTIDPTVRLALKKRLCWSKSRSWIPLGLENPGPGDWHTHVSQEGYGQSGRGSTTLSSGGMNFFITGQP